MTPPHDPAFPRLHGRPAQGWLNDPNGLCHVDGRWHVFFQHNPDAPRHEAIHWGHVSSPDLLRWRTEPVALAPRPGKLDAFGCWSGCMVVDDGVPTAVYSAVTEDSGRSQVVLAPSHDGLTTFTPAISPVVGMPCDHDPVPGDITDVRDPFVFHLDGRRWAIQGAGNRTGNPSILVYDCKNLRDWRLVGTLLDCDDPVAHRIAPANVWECPNLVRVDDQWVLIVSLWRMIDDRHVLSGVRWLLGDLQVLDGAPTFRPRNGGLLDTGPCYYAPQVLAHDGRVLLWAWSWDQDRPPEDVEEAGWTGVLTYPRELAVVDDRVVQRPAAELDGLRRDTLDVTPGTPFAAHAWEVHVPPDTTVRLHLVDSALEGLDIEVGTWHCHEAGRLLVDGSLVEVFLRDQPTHTTRAWPTTTSRWVLDVDGPDEPTDRLRAWTLDTPAR